MLGRPGLGSSKGTSLATGLPKLVSMTVFPFATAAKASDILLTGNVCMVGSDG